MILLISILSAVFLIGFWVGYKRKFRLEHLSKKLIVNSILALLVILTLISLGIYLNIFPQSYAAYATMGLYCIASGFFGGTGIKLMKVNRESGSLKYVHQSFWSHIVPNMLIVAIVALGIYKTGLLTWEFTGIGVTSGLSLVCFGFWGWTINIVPQFRSHKILLLDQSIDWEKVAGYKWITEESLQIDYYNKEELLTDFITYIPPEDQLTIERILSKKIKEQESQKKDSNN